MRMDKDLELALAIIGAYYGHGEASKDLYMKLPDEELPPPAVVWALLRIYVAQEGVPATVRMRASTEYKLLKELKGIRVTVGDLAEVIKELPAETELMLSVDNRQSHWVSRKVARYLSEIFHNTSSVEQEDVEESSQKIGGSKMGQPAVESNMKEAFYDSPATIESLETKGQIKKVFESEPDPKPQVEAEATKGQRQEPKRGSNENSAPEEPRMAKTPANAPPTAEDTPPSGEFAIEKIPVSFFTPVSQVGEALGMQVDVWEMVVERLIGEPLPVTKLIILSFSPNDELGDLSPIEREAVREARIVSQVATGLRPYQGWGVDKAKRWLMAYKARTLEARGLSIGGGQNVE